MAPTALQIPVGPEILLLVVVLVVLGVFGLIGLYLFNYFLRGYNEGAGYTDDE